MSVMDDPEKRDGFLTRWSRRKREVIDEAKPAAAPPQPETVPATEEAEDDFDLSLLPDIEAITAESDITLFFKKGVPEALKNAALRRMWTADASIRDFVAPADFQWDFNSPGGVPGFGPLEADFDLETMLRQAIGGQKPEEAARAEPAALEARPAASDMPDSVPESSPDESWDERKRAAEIASDDARAQVSVSQDSLSADANFTAETNSDMELPIPSRKHGGALPV